MTDSIEFRGDEKSYMVSSDSLELGAATSSGNILLSDSIDEDGYKGVFVITVVLVLEKISALLLEMMT